MAPRQTPWHEVALLRDDLKSGELSLAVFAADLYDVVMQKGQRRVYEDPKEFFALTYPTLNLRELVRDVILRLEGKSDKAYRKLSVNYGGGKTHALITLLHLVNDPATLPDLPAVQEFVAHIGTSPPKARVAALCFDKIDVEVGVETRGPDGVTRSLRHPWSILAYQLAGVSGLRAINAGNEDERETPPAEPLLVDLLSMPQEEGLSTLVLMDEVLMYLRVQVESDPATRGSLRAFFQYLTQAVVKVDRCAMVASLLASDPSRNDDLGAALLSDVSDVFGRQMEEDASPVGREDVAEVLRRRFFTPDSIGTRDDFRPHVTSVVRNIAGLDDQIAKGRQAAEDRFLNSYPFHPDLTEIFYQRWTQLDGFQRTRGILRTFATALRDAEPWDTSPVVGPSIFLNTPGREGLAEAAGELASFASVDTGTGTPQTWRPILEGELEKAREIQSEATGLDNREVEQAVMSVFLCSQPIGQRALTPELMVLVGAGGPDKIEFEKALRRWTELSWFLDEAEIGTTRPGSTAAATLPSAWRLGNRPNLRQMHDDACLNRVSSQLVEAHMRDAIGRERSLTIGASATGARVHLLPERPSDISDDGDFHYAVLGPEATSDSGKPSPMSRRFIDETTSADRPRSNRNALVLAAPSGDGLDAVRTRVREYLGWLDVQDQLSNQAVDPIREQMLLADTTAASNRIPAAIRQAYSIVVTVNDSNSVHAFKIAATDEPLFNTIKADRRSRIQETAISSEAMLPGGPYDLWREGEASRRVRDLVNAFAQNPRLPKMLRRQEIIDTVAQGVGEGIWVAQLTRPDRTTRTFWRTPIDDHVLEDPSLELLLPNGTTLSELSHALLKPEELPGLWGGDEITVQDLRDYFLGQQTITLPRDGYEDILSIPGCDAAIVDEAVMQAVADGLLWMISGPASILGEPVPPGILGPATKLRPPPEHVPADELTAQSIPDAWVQGKTTALAIATALSTKQGVNLPWTTVRSTIDSAVRVRWLETTPESGPWPCEFGGAQHVVLQTPEPQEPGYNPSSSAVRDRSAGMLRAEATLGPDRVLDLADVIPELLSASIGSDVRFNVRVEVGGATPPSQDAIERINSLLAKVSADLRLT